MMFLTNACCFTLFCVTLSFAADDGNNAVPWFSSVQELAPNSHALWFWSHAHESQNTEGEVINSVDHTVIDNGGKQVSALAFISQAHKLLHKQKIDAEPIKHSSNSVDDAIINNDDKSSKKQISQEMNEDLLQELESQKRMTQQKESENLKLAQKNIRILEKMERYKANVQFYTEREEFIWQEKNKMEKQFKEANKKLSSQYENEVKNTLMANDELKKVKKKWEKDLSKQKKDLDQMQQILVEREAELEEKKSTIDNMRILNGKLQNEQLNEMEKVKQKLLNAERINDNQKQQLIDLEEEKNDMKEQKNKFEKRSNKLFGVGLIGLVLLAVLSIGITVYFGYTRYYLKQKEEISENNDDELEDKHVIERYECSISTVKSENETPVPIFTIPKSVEEI